MSYEFCSKFHTLSSSAKHFENRLRFDKVTAESSKVGTFLRHSVDPWRRTGPRDRVGQVSCRKVSHACSQYAEVLANVQRTTPYETVRQLN